MPSALAKRMLASVPNNGFANAKRQAILALKKPENLDSNFNPTEKAYREAMTYLEPYISSSNEAVSLQAQSVYSGYENAIGKMAKKSADQNTTVANFKLQEQDSYFVDTEGDDNGENGMRDPAYLVSVASESLDSVLVNVQNTIDAMEANNESTDSLKVYRNSLQKRADAMRDLYSKFSNGELTDGQSLDGFGYYVDSNPIDGSIRRAGILPVGNAPEGLDSGFKRLESTTRVGGSLLPVYAPAQKNSNGEYVSKVGAYTWTGTGDGILSSTEQNGSTGIVPSLLNEGGFSIADRNKFQSKPSSLEKGSFGTGIIGVDEQGNAIEATFFRGHDGKMYNIDSVTREKFMADPVLNQKLNGYMPRFSPEEVKNFSREALPLQDDKISTESRLFGALDSAAQAKAESDRMENMGFFQKVGVGLNVLNEKLGGTAADMAAPQPASSDMSVQDPNMFSTQTKDTTFFAAKNTPNKPDTQSVQNSAPDLIDKGKSFFRNVYNKVVNAK